jgi:hypothetical protein
MTVSVYCQVILKPGVTSGQLSALGTALWRCCTRAAGDTNLYQYLDNQALADLLAGQLPAAGPAGRRVVRFAVRDGAARDRRAILGRLRRDLPADGVEDIVVDGPSWGAAET